MYSEKIFIFKTTQYNLYPFDPYLGLPGNPEEITNCNINHDSNNKWHYRGRPEEKAFLYEIVANKISGK